MSLLQGAKRFGGNLLDFISAVGNQQFSPEGSAALEGSADPAAVAAAKRMYDQNYRAARWKAIQQGAWLGADSAAASSAAQPMYETALTNAVTIADALRKRREESGRSDALMNIIARSTDLTDSQREALRAASPDDASEVLLKTAFPNAGQGGDAVHGTFEGDNGNMWVIGNDGKPVDTGAKYNRRTAELNTLYGMMGDPRLLGARFDRGYAGASGAAYADADAAARSTLPSMKFASEQNLMRMGELRAEMAAVDSGQLAGRLGPYFGPKWQQLEASLMTEALMQIGQLRAMGVSLNPLTEKEVELLLTTSPKLTNRKEANLQIIDSRMKSVQRILDDVTEKMNWISQGKSILDFGFEPPAKPDHELTPAERLKKLQGGGK